MKIINNFFLLIIFNIFNISCSEVNLNVKINNFIDFFYKIYDYNNNENSSFKSEKLKILQKNILETMNIDRNNNEDFFNKINSNEYSFLKSNNLNIKSIALINLIVKSISESINYENNKDVLTLNDKQQEKFITLNLPIFYEEPIFNNLFFLKRFIRNYYNFMQKFIRVFKKNIEKADENENFNQYVNIYNKLKLIYETYFKEKDDYNLFYEFIKNNNNFTESIIESYKIIKAINVCIQDEDLNYINNELWLKEKTNQKIINHKNKINEINERRKIREEIKKKNKEELIGKTFEEKREIYKQRKEIRQRKLQNLRKKREARENKNNENANKENKS